MQVRAGRLHPTTDFRECRQLYRERAGVHVERRGEDSGVIKGLAAVFYKEDDPGTEYYIWSDTVERIHPGAFDRAIKENHDARGLFNHDANQLLGRVSSGTCRLSVSADGLAYEIDVDDNDPDSKRVCAKVDRGDVTGSSFAMIVRKVTWEEQRLDDDSWLYIRNIHDVDLYDVGPVTWPAYEGTTAGRSSDSKLTSKLSTVARSDGAAGEYGELLRERESQLRLFDDDDVRLRLRVIGIN